MDKKNIFLSVILILAGFFFIGKFGLEQISSLRTVTYVEKEESLPEGDGIHPIVLSSEGYNTTNDDFRVIAGELYVSMDYVNVNYASERFFYDDNDYAVIYTTSSSILNCSINKAYDLKENKASDGSATFVLRYADAESKEKKIFMNAEQVSRLYGVEYHYNAESNVLILQEEMNHYVTVQQSEEPVYLKVYPEESSIFMEIIGKKEGCTVYEELTPGTRLVYYGEQENFYKVADDSGVIGYVSKDQVSDIQYVAKEKVELDTYTMPERYQLGDRISVIWQYFGAYNSWFDEYIAESYEKARGGLTVIAPTWLHVWKDDDGNPFIQNSIDTEYLDWAHRNGYKVWVTLENVDNYYEDVDEMQYQMLSDTETRQAIVQQMLEWYQEYKFDGINIDLEAIEERLGPYYVQFMRELSAVLRPAGCMVTIDLNVPTSWTRYYRHDVMGQVCDYVCLMAYDEHYASDLNAGSVASYTWVQGGVQDCLTEGVPSQKLVLCMPLYTRIWYLDSSGFAMPDMTRTVDMEEAWYEVTVDRGIEPSWDSVCQQYYAEWMSYSTRVRTWLEDSRSMQARIDLAVSSNLGGVALWSKGRDTEEIWQLVAKYLKG